MKLLSMDFDAETVFKSAGKHRLSLLGAPGLLLNKDIHRLSKGTAARFRNQFAANSAEIVDPLADIVGRHVDEQRWDKPNR
jgi:hypothetical protein